MRLRLICRAALFVVYAGHASASTLSTAALKKLHYTESWRTSRMEQFEDEADIAIRAARFEKLKILHAQNLLLGKKNAIAEQDLKDSEFRLKEAELLLAEAKTRTDKAAVRTSVLKYFAQHGTDSALSGETDVIQLFVRRWELETEEATHRQERAKLTLAHRSYQYELVERLVKKKQSSQLKLMEAWEQKANSESLLRDSEAQLTEAKAFLKMATEEAKAFSEGGHRS